MRREEFQYARDVIQSLMAGQQPEESYPAIRLPTLKERRTMDRLFTLAMVEQLHQKRRLRLCKIAATMHLSAERVRQFVFMLNHKHRRAMATESKQLSDFI